MTRVMKNNPALLEIIEEGYCKANWVRVCMQELSTKNVDMVPRLAERIIQLQTLKN